MRRMSHSLPAKLTRILAATLLAAFCVAPRVALAQPDDDPVKAENPETKENEKPIPLNKQETVLLDLPGKRVLLKTKVVLREATLEMLLCKKQTKEHESILSIDAQAYAIHAGLVRLGAEPGQPAKFVPEFVPPKGPRIDIFLTWKDEEGKLHRVPAQQWIRYVTNRFYVEKMDKLPHDVLLPKESELKYDGKFKELTWFGPMTTQQREELLALSQDKGFRAAINKFYNESQPRQFDTHWVFVGSVFSVDETNGRQFYNAERGEVICVSNFPTSMIDVAVESSSTGEANLLFEPWTERVPPIDTEVTVELIPVLKKPENENKPSE